MEALRFRIALLRHDATRLYQRWAIWKILRAVPRHIKYWAIIETATRGEMGNPAQVSTIELLNRLYPPEGYVRDGANERRATSEGTG